MVVATHPQYPNQFAVGLTDGGVFVFEPLESDSKWGMPPSAENGMPISIQTTPPVSAACLDQPQG